MGKTLLIVLAVVGGLALIGGAAMVGLTAVRTLKPDLVDTGLQKELSMGGVTVGVTTGADLTATFGEPGEKRQETLSTVYVYPAKGLLFRIDKQSGKLAWYEISGKEYATAKGIKVGASYNDLLDAYGPTDNVTLLPTGTRVRYKYGMAYVLEFWLDKSNHVNRIAFYRV